MGLELVAREDPVTMATNVEGWGHAYSTIYTVEMLKCAIFYGAVRRAWRVTKPSGQKEDKKEDKKKEKKTGSRKEKKKKRKFLLRHLCKKSPNRR